MTVGQGVLSPGAAFVFPAFHTDFTDHPGSRIYGFDEEFRGLLGMAARSVDHSLMTFDFTSETFPGDELRTQYITYIYSCAAASLLRKLGLVPVLNAGYSMGIYAALCDSGAITFEAGLELIRTAYNSLKSVLRETPFAMGAIIGLDRANILELINDADPGIVITNCNAEHSFVVSGPRHGIERLLQTCKLEGALNTRILEASIPYHAPVLEAGARTFTSRISEITFSEPRTPLISLVDGNLITDRESIRREVIRNLDHPLDWYTTFREMLQMGTALFVECGLATGLARNSRFTEGDFRFLTIDKAFRQVR